VGGGGRLSARGPLELPPRRAVHGAGTRAALAARRPGDHAEHRRRRGADAGRPAEHPRRAALHDLRDDRPRRPAGARAAGQQEPLGAAAAADRPLSVERRPALVLAGDRLRAGPELCALGGGAVRVPPQRPAPGRGFAGADRGRPLRPAGGDRPPPEPRAPAGPAGAAGRAAAVHRPAADRLELPRAASQPVRRRLQRPAGRDGLGARAAARGQRRGGPPGRAQRRPGERQGVLGQRPGVSAGAARALVSRVAQLKRIERPSGSRHDMPSAESTSPFPGPRPFTAAERERFFGRAAEQRDLSALVIAHPITVLYGPSGAGKTSLVAAAVAPALEQAGFQVLPIARVGGMLPSGIDLSRVHNVHSLGVLMHWHPGEPTIDELGAQTLDSFVHALPRASAGAGGERPLALIIDQLEDLFSASSAQWAQREDFLRELAACLRPERGRGGRERPVRILLVIDEVKLAELERHVAVLPDLMRVRYRLERLAIPAAVEAIVGPAKAAITRVDAETLARELAQRRVWIGTRRAVVAGEFVEPMHIQLACEEMWRRGKPGPLAKTFDPDEALARFYDVGLARARRSRGRERKIRRWFAEQLQTPDGVRVAALQGKRTHRRPRQRPRRAPRGRAPAALRGPPGDPLGRARPRPPAGADPALERRVVRRPGARGSVLAATGGRAAAARGRRRPRVPRRHGLEALAGPASREARARAGAGDAARGPREARAEARARRGRAGGGGPRRPAGGAARRGRRPPGRPARGPDGARRGGPVPPQRARRRHRGRDPQQLHRHRRRDAGPRGPRRAGRRRPAGAGDRARGRKGPTPPARAGRAPGGPGGRVRGPRGRARPRPQGHRDQPRRLHAPRRPLRPAARGLGGPAAHRGAAVGAGPRAGPHLLARGPAGPAARRPRDGAGPLPADRGARRQQPGGPRPAGPDGLVRGQGRGRGAAGPGGPGAELRLRARAGEHGPDLRAEGRERRRRPLPATSPRGPARPRPGPPGDARARREGQHHRRAPGQAGRGQPLRANRGPAERGPARRGPGERRSAERVTPRGPRRTRDPGERDPAECVTSASETPPNA
jgi:hypothetical protein